MKRAVILLGCLMALAFFAAGCSGDGDAARASGNRSAAAAPLFSVFENDGRQVLGTGDGLSLYIFDGDGVNESNCTDDCALTFIPFEYPDESWSPGASVDESLIGDFERDDGGTQITYGGRALYRFSADREVGDSGGEGSGGRWFLISPDGLRVPRNE